MSEQSHTPRSWLVRAATSAGPVKTLAGTVAAIIGVVAVILPLMGGGSTDRAVAEITRARLTQPVSKGDFEVVTRGVRSGEASGSWPGAWIRLRIRFSGVDETRFTWAVLEVGTNDVRFTSEDAGVGPAGPAPSRAGRTVLADVWVPFPKRSGRYRVIVSVLPRAGDGLDEYVSPPFRVGRPARSGGVGGRGGHGDGGHGGGGSGAAPSPTPAPTPAPGPVAPDLGREPVSDASRTTEQTPEAPEPDPATTTAAPPEAPQAPPPDDLPDIEVPDPEFSATS